MFALFPTSTHGECLSHYRCCNDVADVDTDLSKSICVQYIFWLLASEYREVTVSKKTKKQFPALHISNNGLTLLLNNTYMTSVYLDL